MILCHLFLLLQAPDVFPMASVSRPPPALAAFFESAD